MKQCISCGEEKPLSSFFVNRRMLDGHLNRCKTCAVKIHRIKYAPVNRKKRKMISKKYGLSVRSISDYGLKLALLIYDRANRRCEKCGSENDLMVHHKDGKGRNYMTRGLKPNNNPDNLTIWCDSCHSSFHAKKMWKTRDRTKFPFYK